MNQLFSPDNPVMKFLATLCDLLLVNLFFVITSIPIFTMGASLSAMYSVIFKMQRNEDSSIRKDYFNAFKSNFKQSTLIWLPTLVIIAILFVDLYLLEKRVDLIGESYTFLKYPISILLFALLAAINYLFPQIAAFKNTNKVLIKNAFLLAIGNLPTTLSFMIICALIYLIANLSATLTVLICSILCFIGFALIAYIFSFFYRRIFNKILNNNEEDTI